jgi:hypothetical protein
MTGPHFVLSRLGGKLAVMHREKYFQQVTRFRVLFLFCMRHHGAVFVPAFGTLTAGTSP